MRICRSILLLYLTFILVAAIALVILFEYGGPVFIAFVLIVSCIFGAAANYILEKRDKDEL